MPKLVTPKSRSSVKREKKALKRVFTQPDYIGNYVYIKPSYIVTIPAYSWPDNGFSASFIDNQKNLRDNKHNGRVSVKSDKKIRAVVNWLLLAAEEKTVYRKSDNSHFTFKVNFITLTLPDTKKKIDERAFKKELLNPFLVYCRKFLGLRNYIWKMEFHKNGKLHLHLTTDTFIHWERIRKAWNNVIRHNGYMLEYTQKFMDCTFEDYCLLCGFNDKRSIEDKYRAWEKGTKENWQNPNTTDVHSVRKIKNLAGYICKYMAKQEKESHNFKGRIWGSNYELSRALKCTLFVEPPDCAKTLKPIFAKDIEYRTLYRPNPKTGLQQSIGEIFYIGARQWKEEIDGPIKDLFDEKIMAIRNLAHDGTLFRDLYVID